MDEKIMVTLVLQGFKPSASTSQQVEFIGFKKGAATVRGWSGKQERYSLKNGKRLGTNWDFWRLSIDDIRKLRKMKYELKGVDKK